MLRYLASRLVVAALMVLLATLAIFLIANMVPGDPVLTQLGDIAANNPDMVAAFRHKWGLDLPLWDRYWIFLTGLLHGDLGISIASQRPVLDDIAQYAPATVELSTIAFLLALLIGLPLGVLAAMRRDSWIDHLARAFSLVGVSAPTFWLAFIMLAVFYGALEWAPGPGADQRQHVPAARGHRLHADRRAAGRRLGHVPGRRGASGAAVDRAGGQHARADHPHHARRDAGGAVAGLYPRRARQGPARRAIIIGHALPNALLPVVTLGGLAYAQLLTGTVLTETDLLLARPRTLHVPQRRALDFPAIMGITLVVAAIYVLVNLLVDLSYAMLDPRVARR